MLRCGFQWIPLPRLFGYLIGKIGIGFENSYPLLDRKGAIRWLRWRKPKIATQDDFGG
jgi:hypothetical protein